MCASARLKRPSAPKAAYVVRPMIWEYSARQQQRYTQDFWYKAEFCSRERDRVEIERKCADKTITFTYSPFMLLRLI
jgi:hypothetical protein